MKPNFKCPKCKKMSAMGKTLHSKWTCPSCGNSIVPNRDVRRLGYVPFKRNKMFMVGK